MNDEETKETDDVVEPTIDEDFLTGRKLSLRRALKDIYQGKINLGKAGQLKIDVDPFGQDKSASVQYTIPIGRRGKT